MEKWIVLSAIAQAVSTFVAVIAIYQTVQLHKKQMLLEQRQFLLPLWQNLQNLNDINTAKPVWVDVIKAVNILELIAISWEGQLIDENIIRRMYSTLYIEFYLKIKDCKNPPKNVGKDGNQMLLSCPAAIKLYEQLIDEHANRDRLKPISR